MLHTWASANRCWSDGHHLLSAITSSAYCLLVVSSTRGHTQSYEEKMASAAAAIKAEHDGRLANLQRECVLISVDLWARVPQGLASTAVWRESSLVTTITPIGRSDGRLLEHVVSQHVVLMPASACSAQCSPWYDGQREKLAAKLEREQDETTAAQERLAAEATEKLLAERARLERGHELAIAKTNAQLQVHTRLLPVYL